MATIASPIHGANLSRGALYRAVWRWHFYAGLIVLPVLAWLSLTGALYLYKPEIERFLYRDLIIIQTTGRPVQPLARLIEAGEADGGRVTQITRPAAAWESWRLTVEHPNGSRQTAFVDPYTAELIGTTAAGGVMKTVRDLHGLMITGPIGNAVVEIVAGWTILLSLTGLYLWWPQRGAPALGVRGTARGRLFWRDLHASTGALAGLVLLFLALTGMPWSGVWGKAVQGYVAGHGLGRPQPPRAAGNQGHGGHQAAAREALPWSLQQAEMPHAERHADVGPDRIAAVAAAQGLAHGWTMTLPSGQGSTYMISATAVRADEARVIHVEPATARVLQDVGYRDFGAGAQAIEWGIATHQGQQYGEANRLLMLAGCLGVLLLAASAPVMWWKRRQGGRLAAPPRADSRAHEQGAAVVMIAVGAAFPLTGLTMIAALVGQTVARLLWPGARHLRLRRPG